MAKSLRGFSRRTWRYGLVGIIMAVGLGGLLGLIPGDLVSRASREYLAEATTKKCACPLAPGESVFIPCSSVNNPDVCGACSVLSADGKRSGRTCLTIQ